MAIVNKVTTLSPSGSTSVTDDVIQAHVDEMNADGWYLVSVLNLIGWFKFFWAKEQA